MKRTKNSKGALAAVITVFVIALATIILTYVLPKALNDPPVRTRVPTVSAMVRSADKKDHNIISNFTIDVDSSYASAVNADDLHDLILNTISELDYDKIIEEDGFQYVKDSVRAKLEEEYSPDMLKGLYITDIQTGSYPLYSGDVPANNAKGNTLKRFFKSMSR